MNDKEEYIKCLNDSYYFFTKYCVIKDKRTNENVHIKISRKQYNRFIEHIVKYKLF